MASLVIFFPPQPGMKPATLARLKQEYIDLVRGMYPALPVRLVEAKGKPYILTPRGERFDTHVPPPVIGRAGFDSRRWFLIWPLVGLALAGFLWP